MLTFRVLARRKSEYVSPSSEQMIHTDEGLTLETPALESLHGGQITFVSSEKRQQMNNYGIHTLEVYALFADKQCAKPIRH